MTSTAPAAWGKLPVFGDFIRCGATVEQVEDWQRWFAVFPLTEFGAPEAAAMAAGQEQLQVQQNKPNAHQLPWSFVLPPGALPFSGNHYVAGVMSNSCDKVSRRHPFVIYRLVSQNWLERYLTVPQNSLFWLARLLSRYTPPLLQYTDTSGGPVPSLEAQLDRLQFAQRRPRWWQRLGIDKAPDDDLHTSLQLSIILDQLGPAPAGDPALQLQGVSTAPWALWPSCIWQGGGGWFWQQDHQGRYVGQLRVDIGGLG
jgi:type VI secretion system protein ImpM